MKKLLLLLIVLLITCRVQSQVITPAGIVRTPNDFTTFGSSIPKGFNIVNMATNKQYLVVNPLAGTETITSSLAAGLKEIPNLATNTFSGFQYVYSSDITGNFAKNAQLYLKYTGGVNTHETGIHLLDNAGTTRLYLGYSPVGLSSEITSGLSTPLTLGTNGTPKIKIATTGQLTFNNYTSTSSFTGTPTGYLAFNSTGDIITTSGAAGYWQSTVTGGISPLTITDEVRIGTTSDLGDAKLQVTNTTAGAAILGYNTGSGYAVAGTSTGNGIAGRFNTGNNYAVSAQVDNTTTNTVAHAIYIMGNSTGSATTGFGTGILFGIENNTDRAQLNILSSDDGSYLNQDFEIKLSESGGASSTRKLLLTHDGKLTINQSSTQSTELTAQYNIEIFTTGSFTTSESTGTVISQGSTSGFTLDTSPKNGQTHILVNQGTTVGCSLYYNLLNVSTSSVPSQSSVTVQYSATAAKWYQIK